MCQAKPPESTGTTLVPMWTDAGMHFFNWSAAHWVRSLPAQPGGMKGLEHHLVSRMHGEHLPLQIAGDLGRLQPHRGKHVAIVVAIRFRRGRLVQIDGPRIPTGDLNAVVTHFGEPRAD